MCVWRGGLIRPPDRPHWHETTKKVEGLMRCRVVGRANNNANVNGGVVYANANNAWSNSNTNNGSRLANRTKHTQGIEKPDSLENIAPTAYLHGLEDSGGRET